LTWDPSRSLYLNGVSMILSGSVWIIFYLDLLYSKAELSQASKPCFNNSSSGLKNSSKNYLGMKLGSDSVSSFHHWKSKSEKKSENFLRTAAIIFHLWWSRTNQLTDRRFFSKLQFCEKKKLCLEEKEKKERRRK